MSKLKKHVEEISEQDVKEELRVLKSPGSPSAGLKANSALMTPVKRASKVFQNIHNGL